MEIVKKNIIIAFLCSFAFTVMGQNPFFKSYAKKMFNEGNGIVELPEFKYAITGTTGEAGSSSQIFLMMIDSIGKREWTNTYGGDGDDIGVRVFYNEGVGFTIVGYTSSTGNAGFDFLVIKTDESGVIISETHYGKPENWEILYDAVQLYDGGLIMVGKTVGPLTQNHDIFLMRTNAEGDTVWTKTIGNPGDDIAYSVDTVDATNFVIAGEMSVDGEIGGFIASFSLDGTQNWLKYIKDDLGGRATRISCVRFNDYIGLAYVTGKILNEETGYWGLFSSSYDVNGNYSGEYYEAHVTSGSFYYDAFTVKDEFLYISVVSSAPELGSSETYKDLFVYKIVTDGSGIQYVVESFNFSSYGDDGASQMITASDGGVLLVGTAGDDYYSYTNGSSVLAVRLGPDDEKADKPDEPDDLLNIQNEELQTNFVIYPNPTQEFVYIPHALNGKSFALMNAQGQILKQGELESNLSLESLAKGIYFLNVTIDHKIFSMKISKY